MEFTVETDHKPLISLFGKKTLDNLPPRIARFRMRLMRCRFTVSYIPGKEMYTADALSRAPLHDTGGQKTQDLQEEAGMYVNAIMGNLPATQK